MPSKTFEAFLFRRKDDEAAIKAREEFCDTFLKICVEKRIGFIYLGDFLQPPDILEYFSKVSINIKILRLLGLC